MRGTCIFYNISLRYHWYTFLTNHLINKEYYLNMKQTVQS